MLCTRAPFKEILQGFFFLSWLWQSKLVKHNWPACQILASSGLHFKILARTRFMGHCDTFRLSSSYQNISLDMSTSKELSKLFLSSKCFWFENWRGLVGEAGWGCCRSGDPASRTVCTPSLHFIFLRRLSELWFSTSFRTCGPVRDTPRFLPRGGFPSSFCWNSATEAPLRHAFTSECCSQGCFWPANGPISIQMRPRCRFMPAIMEALEAGRISHRGECWSAGWQFAVGRLLKWKYSLCIGDRSCPSALLW